MSEHIEHARENGVLTLTLNRPEKKNALTRAMYRALADAVDGASSDPQTRCVLLQAEGDLFTAGNDLGDFATFDPAKDGENPYIAALGRARVPIVAAVNGRAVGVGLTMLLHCDVVVMADHASLTAPFVDLALVPEAASSMLLVERIGYIRAFAVFALGRAISASEALGWGIATDVLPATDVRATAREYAHRIAALAPASLRKTKTLMREQAAIESRIAAETVFFREQLQSAEAREAFLAFAQKRRPDFASLATNGALAAN